MCNSINGTEQREFSKVASAFQKGVDLNCGRDSLELLAAEEFRFEGGESGAGASGKNAGEGVVAARGTGGDHVLKERGGECQIHGIK